MKTSKKQIWDSLTGKQRRSFGDRFITHESNLNAWDKSFDDLSSLKQKRVVEQLPENVSTLNHLIS